MPLKPSTGLLAIAAALTLGLAACEVDEAANNGGVSGGGGACSSGAMSTTQPVTDAEKCAILKAHNSARAAVGVPDLKWNDTLATNSYNHVQKCGYNHSGDHRRNYGENLMWGTAGGYSVADAVNAWANEKPYYDHASNSCTQGVECGHYTQIVWKTTTEVGCGYARCGGDVIFICQYNPPGNYTGQKPY